MGEISEYWKSKGKTLSDKKIGKTWNDDGIFRCDECCFGDRCDEPSHYYIDECPYCLGTGIPKVNDIDEEQLIMNANSGVNSDFVIEAMKKDTIPKIIY